MAELMPDDIAAILGDVAEATAAAKAEIDALRKQAEIDKKQLQDAKDAINDHLHELHFGAQRTRS